MFEITVLRIPIPNRHFRTHAICVPVNERSVETDRPTLEFRKYYSPTS